DYRNSARFQNFLFTLGPTYKYAVNKLHLEAYVRGGMMMQYFPEHVATVSYEDAVGGWTHWDSKWTNNDASNKANSWAGVAGLRSEEHTSELQSRENLVCRLLLEKKKIVNCVQQPH